ncbi:hypothetical protein [Herbaspirillum sp. RV1423]|uniref:hypothetical protein n=1 Tax=Herbaspirillum sp. RV1423 TaxID=1443993 RepID=UPI0012DC8361|nr:hypothetical protein [Herbaspirillum sp. RV1423]
MILQKESVRCATVAGPATMLTSQDIGRINRRQGGNRVASISTFLLLAQMLNRRI